MLKFGEFIQEGGFAFPVVSVEREKIDLNNEVTRNELNRNISVELSGRFVNPYAGWNKVNRVLNMYSVNLPKTIFKDESEGEEVVALNQFGDVWGADLSGKVSSPNNPELPEFYLYYNYIIDETGFYKIAAVVLDEEELAALLETSDEDDDIDFEGPEGEYQGNQLSNS